MLHAALSAKSHALKSVQPQTQKPAQANDRPQGAFESMLDDNAAQASAAAKEQDQGAAVDRTQKGPAPKAKSDKSAADTKPAADQPPAKAAGPADKGKAADTAETPVIAENTDETDIDVTVEALPEPVAETDGAVAETAVTPETSCVAAVVPVVPVVPVQPVITPADAQGTQSADAEEAITQVTQAPVIAAVSAQQPIETAERLDQTGDTEKTGKPAVSLKEQPADTEQTAAAAPPAKDAKTDEDTKTAEEAQTAAQPEEHAEAEKGTASQVALNDAEKEHIARARGEGAEKTEHAAADRKSEQADPGSTVQKATSDVPTPQVHTASPATSQVSSATAAATAAANPQTAVQTAAAVPVSGVAFEIASKAASGKKEFEIRLDPPELGRIEVRLHVDRDGNVTSRLIADRQDTLDLFKRDSAGLERALQEAGLKTSDNGMQFSLRDQSLGQQQNDGDSNANTARVLVQDEALPTIDIPAQSYGRLAGRAGGLDIRV